jgi:predicted cobalt transporter CbtA
LTPPGQNPAPLAQRLMWFVALWLGGVGTVALIAYGLRLWIAPK